MFWRAQGQRLIMPGDHEALILLQRAAARWRDANQYCNAGLAMSAAIRAAWGNGEEGDACVSSAIRDFEESIRTGSPGAPENLLALSQLALGWRLLGLGKAEIDHFRSELAQRLLRHYADSPHMESYLVRGFTLKSDLDREWEPSFPPLAGWGVSQWCDNVLEIHLPSAFELFVSLTDYEGAYAIVQRCPDAFTTPGLRGWKAAVCGFVRPTEAVEHFGEAAAAFSADTPPSQEELLGRGGSWSSINIELWANYFRARVAFTQLIREPGRAMEFMRVAATAIQGADSGWLHGGARRFRILVQTLARSLGQDPGVTPEQAHEQFMREAHLTGEEPTDEVSLRFLNLVGEAFETFRREPAIAMVSGYLPSAMETLGRIPLIGPELRTALAPAIGAQALREALGPDLTWVHRTLEGITDERIFQRIRASGIFSLPPCGGGRGWGVEVLWQQAFPPPTPTLPHKGGGSFVR
jgi:hypothetical protein